MRPEQVGSRPQWAEPSTGAAYLEQETHTTTQSQQHPAPRTTTQSQKHPAPSSQLQRHLEHRPSFRGPGQQVLGTAVWGP